jgi:tripartite-type tricarboxylate transporter receptor subunit TctC
MPRLLALLLALIPFAAPAQEARPLRLLIPYPAGGTTDIIARAIQEPLRTELAQPVVVENRGGGAGAIAMREVLNATPDGNTLVIANNGPATLLPLLRPDIGYAPRGAFAPVAVLSTTPLILTVATSVPGSETLAGFLAHARANPEKLSYGTAGVGSFGHVATILMTQLAGIQAVHIPYRGQAPMTLALLSGEIHFVLTTTSQAMDEQVATGRLRKLGVSTPQPSPLAPGAPPISTALPGFSTEVWFGLLAPAATPAPVVARLNAAVAKALALPAVQAQLQGAGMLAAPGTVAAFAARLERDAATWASVTAGVRLD